VKILFGILAGDSILAVEFNGLVSKQSRAIPRLAHLLFRHSYKQLTKIKFLQLLAAHSTLFSFYFALLSCIFIGFRCAKTSIYRNAFPNP
jgi:hypothetical protein